MTLRVAALTGGRNVSSARFRVHQYVRALLNHGVLVNEFPARFGSFPPRARWVRPAWGLATLAARVPAVLRTHAYDLTLLQRELVSTLATLEGATHRPRVLDVDDAVWVHQRWGAVRKIAHRCDAIICGNAFLAEYFRRQNPRVFIVPTGVDTQRFLPLEATPERRIIGWTGTSSNFRYLGDVEPALRDVLEARPDVLVRVVADRPPPFVALPSDRVEFVRWSPAIEAKAVRSMTVGIMPLRDSEWERGKCSHKMLLYMAAGVPVVVSPVGMNREVLVLGDIGLAATTRNEWRDALIGLLDDPIASRRMGEAGRAVVEAQFSVNVLARALAGVFYDVAGRTAGGEPPASNT